MDQKPIKQANYWMYADTDTLQAPTLPETPSNPNAPPYYNIDELVGMIDEPNRACCKQYLNENVEILKLARGAVLNHQPWSGGYIDHITEMGNIAVRDYRQLTECRPLTFSLSDGILGCFLHDAEKPLKYEYHVDPVEGENGEKITYDLKPEMKNRAYVKTFRKKIIEQYGFQLNVEQMNSIEFAEGEIDQYSPFMRWMSPVAAFVHRQDIWSARGWYDQPRVRGRW